MAKPSPRPELLNIIRSVRNRWRLRRLMYALALLLAAGVVLLLLTALLLDYFRFAPGPTRLLQFGAYTAFLVLALSLLLRPLWRRVSDRRIALYLEEHEPSLQAALLSAVEHGHSLSPLSERQLEQALAACQQVDNGRRVERQRLHRGAGWLAVAVGLAALVAIWNPAFLRHALPFLTAPISGANASNPYQLSVSPGDVEVEHGADQLISVALQGFSDPEVRLFSRVADRSPPQGAAWRAAPMTPGGEDGGFELFLFDLRQPLEYYVEADGLRSPSYRIEVIEYPVVQSIALTLRYPAYTGKAPQEIPDGGDIVALVGTEVELRVTPSRPAAAGELVLDDGRRLALEPQPDGRLIGNLVVSVDGGYRVELSAPREGSASELRPASPQYVIDALDDRAPTVTLTKPGRDSKVTRIEEPFFELRAEDDLGIGALELVLAVNGEQRPPLRLYSAQEPGDTQLTAGHTLFLEELDLHPGDLISYFARVRDSGGDQARQTETDIYFLEVRPFQRIFRAAEQQGGGGGQQGENDIGLASQQRELVVATFKAIRDRDSFTRRRRLQKTSTCWRAPRRASATGSKRSTGGCAAAIFCSSTKPTNRWPPNCLRRWR